MGHFQKCSIAASPEFLHPPLQITSSCLSHLVGYSVVLRGSRSDSKVAPLPPPSTPLRGNTQSGTCNMRHETHAEASTSASSLGMGYLHRATFAQALMERSWMKEKEAKKLFQDITGSMDDQAFVKMVARVDKRFTTFSFKLAMLLFPLDSENYIAVVNKASDDVAKTLGSSLSAPQIAFLKTVLEGIALDPNAENGGASIGAMDANNLAFTQTQQPTQASQVPATKLSMTEKERLLPKLVEDGWLAEVPGQRGSYSIGVRAFLELKDFLLTLDLPPDTRRAWERFL